MRESLEFLMRQHVPENEVVFMTTAIETGLNAMGLREKLFLEDRFSRSTLEKFSELDLTRWVALLKASEFLKLDVSKDHPDIGLDNITLYILDQRLIVAKPNDKPIFTPAALVDKILKSMFLHFDDTKVFESRFFTQI